ncbi:MAG: 50S ribosomal protein L9 [bacterium]|nr:50S ribosomal protein L9 [bacterium]
MEVILLDNLKGLGVIGDIKEVKAGYARNFLFPKGLALAATKKNMKVYEIKKASFDKARKTEIDKAQNLAEKIGKLELSIAVKVGDEGKLFGSVTNADIAECLAKEGYNIDKRDILLEHPLKDLGVFTVEVKIYQEVKGFVKVFVIKE